METRRHCTTSNLWVTMKARGQTMTWLARSVGLSRSMLYRMKAGNRAITEDVAQRIAVAMGLPFDALFFFTPASTSDIENRSLSNDMGRAAD